jgi:hypothetical protein
VSIEIGHGGEAGGDLGVDDGVDRDVIVVGGVAECRLRPGPPDWIGGQDIDDEVGIDQDRNARGISRSPPRGPRIRARISSVVILKPPRPRRLSTSF